MLSTSKKIKLIKIFMWIMCVSLFFWWPLSRWLYPDFYHSLLGFEAGSYQSSMVKVIGTIGMVPVLLVFFTAMNPQRNRHMVIVLIVFSVLMVLTYIHLIAIDQFPKLELINVGLLSFAAVFLSLIYPWKAKL